MRPLARAPTTRRRRAHRHHHHRRRHRRQHPHPRRHRGRSVRAPTPPRTAQSRHRHHHPSSIVRSCDRSIDAHRCRSMAGIDRARCASIDRSIARSMVMAMPPRGSRGDSVAGSIPRVGGTRGLVVIGGFHMSSTRRGARRARVGSARRRPDAAGRRRRR